MFKYFLILTGLFITSRSQCNSTLSGCQSTCLGSNECYPSNNEGYCCYLSKVCGSCNACNVGTACLNFTGGNFCCAYPVNCTCADSSGLCTECGIFNGIGNDTFFWLIVGCIFFACVGSRCIRFAQDKFANSRGLA